MKKISFCLLVVASVLPASGPAISDTKPDPEFGGRDAMTLVDRKDVKTDCTIDWIAKSGKRYCFADEAAKAAFLKTPDENVDKATDMAAAETVTQVEKAMDPFTSDDAAAFVTKMIKEKAAKSGGTYAINDNVTSASIPLVYDSIDFTRTLKGYGFFPDVRFHAKEDAQKKYLIDYWVVPRDGKLAVPRYNFDPKTYDQVP